METDITTNAVDLGTDDGLTITVTLEVNVFEFLAELAFLCNEYGVEIVSCDNCSGVILNPVDKHIENYHFQEGHITPVYALEVKAA